MMWGFEYPRPDCESTFDGLPKRALIWLSQVVSGRTTDPRSGYPRTPSTAFDDPASTRLGQFFGPAADKHPGLSGFSLLSQAREAFIARLALADLAERSLDMQYYMWDGDTTGRIIVEHVMKAADRGVRVRLLVDDPYYKDSDSVKAGLDAHPNVEIRLFNPLTNRRWSILDFVFDFGRVNRRMHNKLWLPTTRRRSSAAAISVTSIMAWTPSPIIAIWTCWRLALWSVICRACSTDTGISLPPFRSQPS